MARKMKDSGIAWIGEIPAEWKILRIKYLRNNEMNSFQDGDWIESPYITNDGIRYLTTGNVGDGIFKRQGNGYITQETFDKLNCKYAYPQDLVISRLNAPYGRACILPDDEEKYVLAVDIVILRTNHEKQFLCYLMQCDGYQNIVQDSAKGTTMKRISRTNLGNIALPIATLSEQRRIAAFLDEKCAHIDAVIEKTRASIDEYKKLKQAVITCAVTKGIRQGRKMKDSGIEWIGEIPQEWKVRPLKEYIEILPGYAFPSSDFSNTEGVPLLRGINVSPNSIRWEETVYWNGPLTEQMNQFKLRENDLVVGLDRPWIAEGTRVAFVSKTDLPCLLVQRVCRIRAKTGMDIRFVFHAITCKTFEEALSTDTTGVSVPHLSTKQIQNYVITIPPKEEQIEICDYTERISSHIEVLIAKKEQLVAEMESCKKSLIYEYVTGKKEAPRAIDITATGVLQ